MVALKYFGPIAMVEQRAHKISDTGVYQSTITRTIDQHETAFQADLDGDNVIGLNLVSIETNGSYELATSNNKYQIIDRSDSSVVTSFVIQIGVMVGVPRKLRRAQVVALKYFGPIAMVEQEYIKLVTQVFINQRLHAQ